MHPALPYPNPAQHTSGTGARPLTLPLTWVYPCLAATTAAVKPTIRNRQPSNRSNTKWKYRPPEGQSRVQLSHITVLFLFMLLLFFIIIICVDVGTSAPPCSRTLASSGYLMWHVYYYCIQKVLQYQAKRVLHTSLILADHIVQQQVLRNSSTQ